MARLIILFTVIFFVLFFSVTLFSTVTVIFTQTSEAVIEFELYIFRLILYPNRKSEKKKKEAEEYIPIKKRIQKRISRTVATYRAFDFLLPRTDVYLKRFDISQREGPPDKLAVRGQNISSFFYTFIAYVDTNARHFVAEDLTPVFYQDTSPTLSVDLSLKSRLYNIILSYVIFIFQLIKTKRKVTSNGRNKNE